VHFIYPYIFTFKYLICLQLYTYTRSFWICFPDSIHLPLPPPSRATSHQKVVPKLELWPNSLIRRETIDLTNSVEGSNQQTNHPTLFKDEKYELWKLGMLAYLEVKNMDLLDIIDKRYFLSTRLRRRISTKGKSRYCSKICILVKWKIEELCNFFSVWGINC